MGKCGVAITVLRPSGIAEFDGERLNVVSQGDFIGKDAAVKVIAIEGGRIVVAPVKD
jgi:membrane-bound serine protease (ClpP class)